MHQRNPSMPKSKLSELSSVEWETSNSSCSDWLHYTHDIFLANRENPLTQNPLTQYIHKLLSLNNPSPPQLRKNPENQLIFRILF